MITCAGVEDNSTRGRKALVPQRVLNYNKILKNRFLSVNQMELLA
jgi:hypothetical protein